MLPDVGLAVLSFTIDASPAFAIGGIALALGALALGTLILYQGIDRKWSRAAFGE